VFIDGAQLTFSDTNVLGSLGMLGNAYHQEHKVGIHFYRFSEPNKKIFEIVGLNQLVGVHDTLSAALRHCQQALKTSD
jgi:anti-anti-sigma regulatory factor